MAGPYAHILVCQYASQSNALAQPLKALLAANPALVSLGAVAPDLPAIWDKVDHQPSEWSERFHTAEAAPQKTPTNRVVEEAFLQVKTLATDEARGSGLAWLLGYVGHMTTDMIVHPVVRLAKEQAAYDGITDLGPLHQQIEIVMDTLLLKDLLGKEVAAAPILGMLRSADDQTDFSPIMNAWSAAILAAYGETADPGHWYASYVDALRVAKHLPFQFRGYAYRPSSDISDYERKSYFYKLMLPNDQMGSYLGPGGVFGLAVSKVAERWTTLWDRWTSGGSAAGVLPDWDLNSGKVLGSTKLDLWPEGPALHFAGH